MWDALTGIWTAITFVVWFFVVLPWYASPVAGLLVNGVELILLGALYLRGRLVFEPDPEWDDEAPEYSAEIESYRTIVEHHHFYHHVVEHVVRYDEPLRGYAEPVVRPAIKGPRIVQGEVVDPEEE